MSPAAASCLIAAFRLPSLLARDEQPSDWKTLELRYAQANLELAQARLALANSQNQKAASESTMNARFECAYMGFSFCEGRLGALARSGTSVGSSVQGMAGKAASNTRASGLRPAAARCCT